MSKNGFKTFILLAGLTALLLFIGQAMGGDRACTWLSSMALLMNFIGYWFSDKNRSEDERGSGSHGGSGSGSSSHRRTSIRPGRLTEAPGIRHAAGYPNAFATGRNPEHAAVAVTEGILRLLKPENWTGSWPMSSPISRTAIF